MALADPEPIDSDEAPSGMPDEEPEVEPLGIPASESGADQPPPEPGLDAMPGIPTEGDPPGAG